MDSDSMDTDTTPPGTVHGSPDPVKIRKKPGRKPNPASPALRKAQNRAAQRAFRERKEVHLKELESDIKQVRQERDQFASEIDQLKGENDVLKSENWYLKGIVLSLQLVCFQHNLTVPPHGPYINEQSLAVLAQSIPEPIATYFSVNSKSKTPSFNKNTMNTRQQDRYVHRTKTPIIVSEGTSPQSPTSPSPPPQQQQQQRSSVPPVDLPDLASIHDDNDDQDEQQQKQPLQKPTSPPPLSRPVRLNERPLTSNLAAIQALRLRLRLQAACVRMSALPFAIQPTLLQLTIPHDPRIDLIPTPHMRDRMILFRDQFNLDDCFRCLLNHSVFHGGDPAIAANWELPPEFFEKYWFLTIDWSLHRMTNQWRRMQGLEEVPTHTMAMEMLTNNGSELPSFWGLDFSAKKSSPFLHPSPSAAATAAAAAEPAPATTAPEEAGAHHYPPLSQPQPPLPLFPQSHPSPLASSTNFSSKNENDQELFSNTPILLTSGHWPPPQKQTTAVSANTNHGKESFSCA